MSIEDTKAVLQTIATSIEAYLPEGHGFILLTFPFGEADGKSRVNYVANGKREDCINAMKEFLIRAGAEEDWMQHLP